MRGPEDSLRARPAILRAVPILEAEVSARRHPLAISAAPGFRNKRSEVPRAAWAGGIPLETRVAGRCPQRLAPLKGRWEADGNHLGIRVADAAWKWLAAKGAMDEATASGIHLEIQGIVPLTRVVQDFQLPGQAA